MSKTAEMQRLIRLYREMNGTTEINMHDVVDFAIARGWQLPKPIDPRDRLAKEFSDAARQETRYDKRTLLPYRANHAVTETRNGKQLTFWIDIDNATRPKMQKSLVQRREQMVGDAYQLTLDMDHWNDVNSAEQPIKLPMDFTFDVALRKAADGLDEAV